MGLCIMHCFENCEFDKVRLSPIEEESDNEDDDIPLSLLVHAESSYG